MLQSRRWCWERSSGAGVLQLKMDLSLVRLTPLSLALLLVLSNAEARGADSLAGAGIGGSWMVRWEGQPGSDVIEIITIEGTGTRIEVRGHAWKGTGTFEGPAGDYAWAFDDGRTGHTTLWRDGAGALHGQVRNAPIDWDFVATRE
jgi:hypothetical protein